MLRKYRQHCCTGTLCHTLVFGKAVVTTRFTARHGLSAGKKKWANLYRARRNDMNSTYGSLAQCAGLGEFEKLCHFTLTCPYLVCKSSLWPVALSMSITKICMNSLVLRARWVVVKILCRALVCTIQVHPLFTHRTPSVMVIVRGVPYYFKP